MEGKVVYEGQTLILKTAFAEWSPKSSRLMLYLYPFEVTPDELAIYVKGHDYRPLKKPSTDPAKWPGRVPWVLVGVGFSEGVDSLTSSNMTGASVTYMNFEKVGSSVTTSGDGFKLYTGFKSFATQGSAVGDKIELSLRFQQKFPACDIEVRGKTVIINRSRF